MFRFIVFVVTIFMVLVAIAFVVERSFIIVESIDLRELMSLLIGPVMSAPPPTPPTAPPTKAPTTN